MDDGVIKLSPIRVPSRLSREDMVAVPKVVFDQIVHQNNIMANVLTDLVADREKLYGGKKLNDFVATLCAVLALIRVIVVYTGAAPVADSINGADVFLVLSALLNHRESLKAIESINFLEERIRFWKEALNRRPEDLIYGGPDKLARFVEDAPE